MGNFLVDDAVEFLLHVKEVVVVAVVDNVHAVFHAEVVDGHFPAGALKVPFVHAGGVVAALGWLFSIHLIVVPF